MNQKEKLFFDKLKDIFIGAKIEGDSGFINLMRIKSAYFDVIFKELNKEIEEKTKDFPDFKEEMFDKLYTFFKTYFSESGSIYFNYTPLKSKVYERIYSPNKDVILFWKTHMLYYVKTDRLWNNLTIDFDEDGVRYKINFDVSKLQHKKANEKREIIYELKEIKDKELTFNVLYSERGRKTKTDEILRTFKKKNIHLDEERLLKIFKTYEKQNEVDYFINKNAEQFLKEQFNLWLKNYLFDDESDFSEKRLKQLKVLKEIAYKVIDFVAQFEDELVKIWNKPKFVLNSNYVVTLNRIAKKEGGIELIEKIVKHKGFEEQKKEWKDLGILDEFNENKLFINTLNGKELSKEYQFLPIDTKYFDEDIKLELLSLFDDLDNELDGWLIHSENYQALKTILPKFREKVQTIYIDPPYNTGSDEFVYKDRFRHSSWLTMMENRLELVKELMSDQAALFVHIDENEQPRLRVLLEDVFNPENYLAPMIWIARAGKGGTGTKIQISHEHIEVVAKNITQLSLKPVERVVEDCPYEDEKGPYKRELLRQWGEQGARREDRPSLYFPIPTPFGKEVYPKRPDGTDGRWRFSKQKVMKMLEEGDLDFVEDEETGEITVYRKIREGQKVISVPGNILDNVGSSADGTKTIKALFGEKVYDTAKPVSLGERLVELVTWQLSDEAVILDFFAGSGTTAHTVMKLNKEDGGKRKFILVEMADYFDTVIIPRIKKVAYSFNWKDGKSQDNDGIGIFFKYYYLEQYEQTLKRAVYKESHPFVDFDDKSIYQQYVFMKDLKLLDAMKLDYENNKVRINFDEIYPNIDLAETLSNLTGKAIKKIERNAVVFEDGSKVNFDNIDFNLIKPLIWW